MAPQFRQLLLSWSATVAWVLVSLIALQPLASTALSIRALPLVDYEAALQAAVTENDLTWRQDLPEREPNQHESQQQPQADFDLPMAAAGDNGLPTSLKRILTKQTAVNPSSSPFPWRLSVQEPATPGAENNDRIRNNKRARKSKFVPINCWHVIFIKVNFRNILQFEPLILIRWIRIKSSICLLGYRSGMIRHPVGRKKVTHIEVLWMKVKNGAAGMSHLDRLRRWIKYRWWKYFVDIQWAAHYGSLHCMMKARNFRWKIMATHDPAY